MNEAAPLNTSSLAQWTSVGGVERPRYARTLRQRICHIGPGRFHRAHQADYLHRLLQAGDADGWGLCAINLRAADRVWLQDLARQDGLYTLWTLDGRQREARVIGSIMEVLDASADAQAAIERLADESTRIISLTVTEAGYCLRPDGELDLTHADIAHDLVHVASPRSAPGLIVRALAQRRAAGRSGCTLLSCDNLIGNGHQLRRAVLGLAARIDRSLASWIESNASFPCSMVDRITPVPDTAALQAAQADWPVHDRVPLMCEPWTQWVIEDAFIAGRPPFERAGAVFTREVEAYERIKVGLLNGGHSALAHAALLLGYEQVHDALADDDLHCWLNDYMGEVMPTLPHVAALDLDVYRASLLQRFANPAIGDRLLRLAQDTSTKFQQTLIPPLILLLEQGGAARCLTAALALWMTYLDALVRDPPARAQYQDLDAEALIAEASAACRSGDVTGFLRARFALPAAHELAVSTLVSQQLRVLREQGVRAALQSFTQAS